MTPEDFAVIFRNAVLSNYVLPGLIFTLCAFGGAVVALGLRRRRDTAVIPGVFFVISGFSLGDRYTVVPLLFFGLLAFSGLLAGLKRPARGVQRVSRVRRIE